MINKILLVEPPTYPKGTISLSLFVIAEALRPEYKIEYLDQNFTQDQRKFSKTNFDEYKFVGFKVSAQNFSAAIELTNQIRKKSSEVKVVWGGELPTLMPEECLKYADTIVSGLFEPVAEDFLEDLRQNTLQKHYKGKNEPSFGILSPDYSILNKFSNYNEFMGLPMETSRGCTENCTFCMVMVMQKKNYHIKNLDQLKQELVSFDNRFINIVDYNFGVDKQHVLQLSRVIEESDALGWMAEMNIELLDNDEVLEALRKSRCRMVYCGLESVDEEALDSVNKAGTNKVINYERIIRKVQSYGINIAAGVIIGLDNADAASYRRTFDFYSTMGVVYAKFTFLTFNPGTRIKNYMSKQGSYITEEIDKYDGNHLTYLPKGIEKEELYEITENFISRFYSLPAIVKRAMNGPSGILNKVEFILFNICYSQVYKDWLREDIFSEPDNFKTLLREGYTKSTSLSISEKLLQMVRQYRKFSRN